MMKFKKICPYCMRDFELDLLVLDLSKCKCPCCSNQSRFQLKLKDYIKILFIVLLSCVLFFLGIFFGLENRFIFYVVSLFNVIIALLSYYKFGKLRKRED